MAEEADRRLILAVDDQAQVVRGVSRILRANGFDNMATTTDARIAHEGVRSRTAKGVRGGIEN